MAKEICLKKKKNSFHIHFFTVLSLFFCIVKVLSLFYYSFVTNNLFVTKRLKSRKKRLKTLINQHLTGNSLAISILETSKKLKKFKKKKTKHFLLLRIYCNINVTKEI